METLREFFLDTVFGNGRIALGVVLVTVAVIALARLSRIVKF